MLESLGLVQIINEPTRCGRTISLLDVIITNKKYGESGTLDLGISDHLLVYASCLSDEAKQVKRTIRNFRTYKYFDYIFFQGDLLNFNWDLLYDMHDINDMLNFFTINIKNIFDCHAPIVSIKLKKPPAPWLTDNIKLLQSLRDDAFKKFRKKRDGPSFDYYKQLRNFTNTAIKNEKKSVFKLSTSN